MAILDIGQAYVCAENKTRTYLRVAADWCSLAHVSEIGPYQYRLSPGEAVNAARYCLRKRVFRKPIVWLAYAIAVLLALLVALDLLDGTIERTTVGLIVAVVMLVVLMAFMFHAVSSATRRQHGQSAALRDDNRLYVSGDSLRFENARGTTTMPYGEYHAFAETDGLFVLFQTEAFFNLVPHYALDDAAIAMMREGLVSAGVKRW